MIQLYMQGLRRVPNMSDYGSIRLNNPWKCLNINTPHFAWARLDIAECPRICLKMLNVPKVTFYRLVRNLYSVELNVRLI